MNAASYKTIICHHYSNHGTCRYKNCTFAHGCLELVNKDPINYKKTQCNEFKKYGKCSYNEKCSFMHGKKRFLSVNEKLVRNPTFDDPPFGGSVFKNILINELRNESSKTDKDFIFELFEKLIY